jgi:hypothetical protein
MCKRVLLIFFVWLLLLPATGKAQAIGPEEDTVEVVPLRESDTSAFAVITNLEAIARRQVPQKKVDSLKADEDYWYANMVPERKKDVPGKKEDRGKTLFQESWFRDLLWLIVLCSFIGVVIWYLYSSNILLFRKKAKPILGEGGEEVLTDDIFALPYDAEIGKAESANNFRLAVRLWYLQILKELADNHRIDYRHERTNSDYVSQLYNTPYYRDFFRLTRNFEYTWYGQFDLSAEAYEMMRTDFSTFKKGLR